MQSWTKNWLVATLRIYKLKKYVTLLMIWSLQ